MQPNKINSIEQLLSINGNKGQFGNPAFRPAATPAPQSTPVKAQFSDLQSWLTQNSSAFKGQDLSQVGSTKFNISMDPKTRNINITAPQWYLETKEFQEQVLPEFKKLEGMELNENQFKAMMDSGMISDIQKQVDELLPRFEAISQYKQNFPKATDDDAMTYFRNVAAANQSDKNDEVQITNAFDPATGEAKTMSVKDYLASWKDVGDEYKAKAVTNAMKELENPDIDEKTRAVNMSLLDIMKNKGITDAGELTKWNVGMTSFLAESDKSVPGWITNKIMQPISWLAGDGRSIAEEARDDQKKQEELKVLGGVEGADTAGNVTGSLFNVGADIAITAPLGGAGAWAKGGQLASKLPSIANLSSKVAMISPKAGAAVGMIPTAGEVITGVGTKLDDLAAVSKAGNVAANTIRNVPQNIAFGAAHGATNTDYNAGQDLALNIATDAAAFGGARVVGNIIKSIDTASGGRLMQASQEVGKFGLRRIDNLQSIPVLGSMMKKLSMNITDDAAALKRSYRNAYAYSKGEKATEKAKQEYFAINNAIRIASQRGAPQAQQFRTGSAAFKEAAETNTAMQKKALMLPNNRGSEELEAASQYVNKATILARAEAGQYVLKPEQLDALRTEVRELSTPEREAYRKQIVDATDEITQLGVQNNILDKDLINYMEANPEFADDYIHLQYDISSRKNPYTGQGSPKNQKNVAPVKRLKGVSNEELRDPFLIMNERLQATTRLIAENRVNKIVRQGIDSGAISGHVVADSADVKMLGDLKFAAALERESVETALKVELENLGSDLNLLVDDVEDFAGAGQKIISDRIDESLANMENVILDNPKLADEITTLMDDLGEGREGAEEVAAIGIMHRQKAKISKAIDSALLTSPLGSEERKMVADMFRTKITERFDAAMQAQGKGVRTGARELNARRDEIRRLNAEIGTATERNGENVVAYFDNGTKGHFELDDPELAAYFNSRKPPVEDGLIARFMTAASRVFRAGTTGLDPVFALFVNPVRDIPQAAVTAGVNVLAPANIHHVLMETQGLTAAQADEVLKAIHGQKEEAYKMATEARLGRRGEEVGKKPLLWQTKGTRMTKMDADTYKFLQAEARDAGRGKKAYVVNALVPTRAIRNMEDLFSNVELATRSRIYNARLESALKRGATLDDAMSEAMFYGSEATANFLNTGAKTKQFVRTVPYLMAAINGKASFVRLFALDPVGVTLRMMGGVAMPATYLAVQNLADPEKAAGYYEIPDYVRRTNFVIMLNGEDYIKIPMSYELANIVNPFREAVETHYDMDPKSFLEILAKPLLNSTPFDLAGFAERDFDGSIDWQRATAQAAGTLAPQLFKPLIEGISGSNMYTGQALNPTDEELIARGDVEADEEITAGDRTYSSRDSTILRGIADLTGVDQGKIQSILSSYGGTVGQYVLNGLDRLVGSDADPIGGRDIQDSVARRVLGSTATGGRSTTDYYAGVDKLQEEKDMLISRLERMDRNNSAAQEEGDQDVINGNNEERQKLIDDYGQKVADFATKFGRYYNRVGGLKPFQVDSLVRLLNLGPVSGTFEDGSYQEGMLGDVQSEAWADANRRASDLGLPNTASRDLFGRTVVEGGEVVNSFYNSTLPNGTIRNRVYGAPKQIAYEFDEIMKANRKEGIPSMYDTKKKYDAEISKLYEAAKGLKGQAATDAYSRISEAQERYMEEAFDPRIRSLIDKYGVEVLRNSKVAKEIESYIMVPGDFTPFQSRTKQPYMKDDAWAYIQDRYGVGKLNERNLPNDKQAEIIIGRVNADIAAGRRGAANFKLNELDRQISEGSIYVDNATMDEIAGMIKALNKRR